MKFPPPRPNPELEALLKRSAEITAAQTPAQKAEQALRQSVSYVRGEMGMEHPDWSDDRLNEITQHVPQAWALAEIDKLRAALSELSAVYTSCWDLVDGGLLLMPSSMDRFEKANAGARKALGFNDLSFDDE